MLKILQNYIWEFTFKRPARVVDVSICGVVLSKFYLNDLKLAQPFLLFMYYINPIFVVCGMIGYNANMLSMFPPKNKFSALT